MIGRASRRTARVLGRSEVAHFGSPSDRTNILDWGVPETWTAMDIYSDFGMFDEDTFPPALEGETLIDYCRRVPNIWSPCSRASDTDLLLYHQDLQEEEIAWTDLMTEEQKARFDPDEPERVKAILEKSIQGVGRAQWFKADSFHGWWEELTGEPYKPSSLAPPEVVAEYEAAQKKGEKYAPKIPGTNEEI